MLSPNVIPPRKAQISTCLDQDYLGKFFTDYSGGAVQRIVVDDYYAGHLFAA